MGISLCMVFIAIGLVKSQCPSNQRRMCGPIPQCKQTCNNIKLLSIKPVCETTDCVDGCFCPPSAPIETWNSNFNMRCISSVDQCICDKSQSFKMCSDLQTPTCNSPVVKNRPGQCGFPRCQCDKNTPIWHQGRCINKHKCTCPDRCTKTGCSVCNRCECKMGELSGCQRKKCPDVGTSEGLANIIKDGCWRLSPSGEQCIFYSPCLDQHRDIGCNSDITARQGNRFCSDCHKCQCFDGKEICTRDEKCEYIIRNSGCWSLVKKQCIFVSPCPEHSLQTCEGLQPGIKMCHMCSKCECIYGAKICSGKGFCPDPKKRGCYIMRKYVTEEKMCYFVSPCPPSTSLSQMSQCSPFDVTKDFCYMYNGRDDVCEFVSPCPLISSCRHGDTICNKCNKCRCNSGSVECETDKCGDPIPNGCWVLRDQTCVFLSPCPNDVVLDGDEFCRSNNTNNFCRSCNICQCTSERFALCTQTFCPRITEAMGCYLSIHGSCVFMAPCPTV